ncbi:MAG: hypothetical protein HY927_01435 [Elusimicrobia bacterium]|nr:hypothetical protein [Elusimicrobiota bacterium]
MKELILLELRKQRLAFIGLAAAVVASVPMVALGARWAHAGVREPLSALMLFWTLMGLPGVAALFGATAGAGLRAEPAASAESVLPLPPQRRALAALAAAAVYAALLAALVLAVALTASPGWRSTLLEQNWVQPTITRSFFHLMGFGMAHILALSFVCAFAFGHGLAGGLAGLFIGAFADATLAAAWGLQELFKERDILAPGWVLILMLLCLGGALFALRKASSRLERRAGLGWWHGPLCGLAMLVGAALCLLTLGATFTRLVSAPQPLRRDPYFQEGREWGAGWSSPALRKAAGQGCLAVTLEGELALFTPKGERVVLVPGGPRRTLSDVAAFPLWRIRSAAWDEDGSLWVLLSVTRGGPGDLSLLHGRPGGRFEVHSAVEGDVHLIVRNGRQLGLIRWAWERNSYAFLPAKGKRPVWKPLTPKERDWAPAGLPSQFHADGLSADGTLWQSNGPQAMTLIGPAGKAASLVDVSTALAGLPRPARRVKERAVLLRAQEGELWVLLAGRWLCRVDGKSGEVRKRWRLAARPMDALRSVQPVEEGFFLHDGERIHFVDWEGRSKRLT